MLESITRVDCSLFIVEITLKKNRGVVLEVMKSWNRLALERKRLADATEGLSIEKKQLAKDSLEVTQAIVRDLSKKCKIFIAQDPSLKIEGICLIHLTPDAIKILQLATHPKNLSILETDCNAYRGVGTALVKAVAGIALEEGKSTLKLDSVVSAVEFYRRFGIEPTANQPPGQTSLTSMKVTGNLIGNIAKTQAQNCFRIKNEPDLLHPS
jgi:hypothetical protein